MPDGVFAEPQFRTLCRQVVLGGLLPRRREYRRQGAADADHDRPDGVDAVESSAIGVCASGRVSGNGRLRRMTP
ncbi:hypothetical protein [Amycolatopsis sp. NPDC050768]|uniref:hypothetical protein n=1 Tax=Amycolatopsis sp. NPDC050768 TaxID=3154839 RepID=UPI00340D507F